MAQTGYTPISLYYSTTAAAVPTNTNLANGELAINITDGKLYYKDNTGTVQLLASSAGSGGSFTNLTVSGNLTLSGGTANGVTYLNGSKVLTSGSALTFDGTNLGLGTASPGVKFDIVSGNNTSLASVLRVNSNNVAVNTSLAYDGLIGSGQLTVQAGSASALVFGANASEQMRLTSTGLGIGTSSPVGKLMVYGSSNIIQTNVGSSAALTSYPLLAKNAVMTIVGDSANNENYPGALGILTTGISTSTRGANLYLNSTRSTNAQLNSSTFTALNANDALGTVLFGGDNSVNLRTVGAAISAFAGTTWSSTNAETYLTFSTCPQNSTNATERVRIDSNGYVGILTTLQNGTRLNVMGGDVVPATSGSTQTGGSRVSSLATGTGGYVLDMGVSNTNAYAWMQVSNSANLASGFTKPLVLQPVGENVGIGNTAPANKLTVAVVGNATLNTPAAHAAVFNSNDAVNNQYYGLAFTNSNSPEGGTQKPQALISCFAAGGSWSSNWAGDLVFATASGGSNAAPTEKFRIASAGQLGIGGANYGTAGQVLTSGGAGAPPTWSTGGGGGGSPGGSNTQVQYNSSGSFAGSSNFTFNGTGITTGFFAPSSSSAPATGISLPSADTLGFSSASQGNGMYFKTFQIGSSGAYVNQLAIGTGVNTSYYSNFYVYALTTTASQAKASDGPGQLYSGNNNIPYRANQVIEAATSGFTSNQYCPVGLESVSRSSGGWQPTQFPTGSFQTFTNMGVYGEAQGASGYPLGAGFYAFAGSYYANATGFYARTYNIAPTSGSSFCYRSDIGPHVFGGNMVGYHSRVVSGQGGNSTYNQTIGWWHSDETANGVGGTAARFEKAGSVVGTITLTTSATSYNTSSDPRLKNITGPVTSDEAKAFVMGLQPKQGTWKVDGSRFCGFLSTDYELIDPSSVSGVAGATEAIGNLIDKDGNVVNAGVVEPTADCLPEGGRWEQTSVKDIYQTLEYGSAAWCANMTAHAQYLQSTVDALVARIVALEAK